MDAKGVARLLLEATAVAFNIEKPFTYVSGLKGPIYVDCRLLLSDVKRRRIIADALVDSLERVTFDVVAATATGAIPWGAWVAQKTEKPMVYVRGEAKAHGKGNLVEGKVEEGQKAVVVEDIVNRGGSSINTINGLRGVGAQVTDCVAIFDYETDEAHGAFKSAGVRLKSLSNFDVAVDEAVTIGYLTDAEAAQARRWASDPKRWR